MNWKVSLDKYLTTPPEDGFDNWCELIAEEFTEEFYDTNEDWIMDSMQIDKWLSKLFRRGMDGENPKLAAKIIERAFNIYIKPLTLK